MSNSDRVQLSYVAESIFGALKAGSPLKVLRYTGESLKQATSTKQSTEIRADRQIPDVTRDNVSASGGVNFELSFGAHDDMIKAALMADADWAMPVVLHGTTFTVSSTDNSISDSGAAFVTAGLAEGQWIRTSGFHTAANNGLFQIGDLAAGKIKLTGGTLVTETAGVRAAGTIHLTGQPADQNTVTIGDGTATVVFEFDTGNGVTNGHTAVTVGGNATETMSALIVAINGSALAITAAPSDPADTYCTLEADAVGSAQNVTIIRVGANITVSGMTGGLAVPDAYFAHTPRMTAGTISAAANDNSLNDSGNGFLTAGFAPYQWVKVSGFTGVGTTANGYAKIVSVTAAKMILSGIVLIDDAATESVTIEAGSAIINGTTAPSFNVEKKFSDLANEFSVLTGMTVNQMSLAVATNAIITGSFTFMGSKEVSATASSGSGYTAAPTNSVMNCVDNVLALLEAGSSMSAQSFSLQLANNLRTRLQIGTLGAVSLGLGKCAITGKVTAYFATQALFNKYLNYTASSLAIVLTDAAGNTYVIDLPRVKFTDGQRVAGGENQDVMADLSWSAMADPTENVTVRVSRFAA